jgi:hypothetical protein
MHASTEIWEFNELLILRQLSYEKLLTAGDMFVPS